MKKKKKGSIPEIFGSLFVAGVRHSKVEGGVGVQRSKVEGGAVELGGRRGSFRFRSPLFGGLSREDLRSDFSALGRDFESPWVVAMGLAPWSRRGSSSWGRRGLQFFNLFFCVQNVDDFLVYCSGLISFCWC